jgi:hypothetical protein
MTIVAINPGSGPVAQASEEEAKKNIEAFAKDLLEKHQVTTIQMVRSPKGDYGEGRFAWKLEIEKGGKKRVIEVQMPGLPLEKVRYMQEADQNIWHFPRLYVDGSSWVWFYAINVTDSFDEA